MQTSKKIALSIDAPYMHILFQRNVWRGKYTCTVIVNLSPVCIVDTIPKTKLKKKYISCMLFSSLDLFPAVYYKEYSSYHLETNCSGHTYEWTNERNN